MKNIIIVFAGIGVILMMASCGSGGSDFNYDNVSCEDLYSAKFCESIRGPAGSDGENGDTGDTGEAGPTGPEGPQGEPGEVGQTGETGPEGPQGEPGEDGEGCSVAQVPEGAVVTCGDSLPVIVWNGTNGKDGVSPVLEVIDLCDNAYRYGEVLLRIESDGFEVLVGHYSDDKKKQHLVSVLPGSWVSTDGFNCMFTVDDDLNVKF